MRKVYLTRDKSFVGCLGKLNVYIEDQNEPEMVIAGIPCKKVCKIKNGETVSFDIGDEAVKIIVIADKLSKDLCNDYYQIPAGVGDIEIGGKCSYNPGAGNPFRFHGVTDEDVLANRKRAGKKGIIMTVVAIAIGFVIGLVLSMNAWLVRDKQFLADDFEITLTTEFRHEYEDGVYYFGTNDCSVAVYSYNYNEHAQITSMNVQDFLILLKNNGRFDVSAELKEESGLTFVEERAESAQGDIRSYFTAIIKSEEAFFLFEFGCETDDYAEYRSEFIKWANTIVIK